MTDAYLDASALVPLAVRETSSGAVQDFTRHYEGRLIVSEFGAAEAASGVSRLVRMGKLERGAASAALEDLDAWRFIATELVEITSGDLRLAHLLVRRFETKLRAADAVHVAVAKRLGAKLVSLDAGMRAGAGLAGVTAVDPIAA